MTKKKKIALIGAIISLIICFYGTAVTYSKYFTKVESNQEHNIKRWLIKVNNEDITNNTELTEQITATYKDNENVKENNIAPGSEGYFEIVIDYSEVDVNFTYEISIADNETVSDIVIYKLEVNNETLNATDGKITGTINQEESTENKTTTIKAYVKWNDDTETETMDDEKDTLATIENEEINFKANMKFTQITS